MHSRVIPASACVISQTRVGITERSADGIVLALAEAGYIVQEKSGSHNRYQIQAHLPLPEPTSRERTVGEVLALPADTEPRPAADQPDATGRLASAA